MEDNKIIDLYFERNESAIDETRIKYGSFLNCISYNILKIREDSEECVSDTYLTAWEKIPPERPLYFKSWLGKIVRNISLSLWRKNHASKRYSGLEEIFDELNECIPSPSSIDNALDEKELTYFINKWLKNCPLESRKLFIKRYWYGEGIKALAKEKGCRENKISKELFNLRNELKAYLAKEGYGI